MECVGGSRKLTPGGLSVWRRGWGVSAGLDMQGWLLQSRVARLKRHGVRHAIVFLRKWPGRFVAAGSSLGIKQMTVRRHCCLTS